MIDCDVHPQIADPAELLAYIESGQRDWFRAQGTLLGLPGYSWAHPSSWYRQDVEQDGGPPGADVAAVRRDLLEATGTDTAVLNADDAIVLSLMPSPGSSRAARRTAASGCATRTSSGSTRSRRSARRSASNEHWG